MLDQLGGGPVGGQERRAGTLQDRVVELAQGGQALRSWCRRPRSGSRVSTTAEPSRGTRGWRRPPSRLRAWPRGRSPGRPARRSAPAPSTSRRPAEQPGGRLRATSATASTKARLGRRRPARGADTDEDHRPVPDRLGLVAGHPNTPPGPPRRAAPRGPARGTRPASADEVQLAGVVVVDHDVVADMGKAGSGDEADVAGTDHGDAHDGRLWFGGGMEVAPDDSRGCRRLQAGPTSLSGSSPDATLRPPMRTRHTPPSWPLRLFWSPASGHHPGPGSGRRRPGRWLGARGRPAVGGAGAAGWERGFGPGTRSGRPATGAVLWGRRSRTPVPPASLTKMLTALAVRASLDLDGVTVASRVAASSRPVAWR